MFAERVEPRHDERVVVVFVPAFDEAELRDVSRSPPAH